MRLIATLFLLAAVGVPAQQPATTSPQPTTAASAAQSDTSFIDSEGRAHITRIVPVPAYLSRQSQYWLREPVPDAGPPESLEQRRAGTDKWALTARDAWLKLYPATLTE